MREVLITAYLEFINEYLTIEKYAEHNGLTVDQAQMLINLAREVFNSIHPEA